MRIALSTPTGKIGNQLARKLLADGQHDLILLVRDPAKVADLTAQGATAVAGDLGDPAYLTKATAGAEAFFFLIPPKYDAPDMLAWQQQVTKAGIAAAQAHPFKHVVLLSSVGAQHANGTGPIAGLHDAEEQFKTLGQPLTILRPGYFMENFFWSLESLANEGALHLPVLPDKAIPMIATQDIAQAAYDALTGPPPAGVAIRELSGPRQYTFPEAAQIIGAALGREAQYVPIPAEAAREYLLTTGVSADTAIKFVEMYDGMNQGTVAYEGPAERIIAAPTSLETFAAQVLAPAARQSQA